MIYWLLQEATTAGEQGAALTWPNILTAGVVGAVISFVGLIIGLIFTQRRHTQTLQTTRELEDHRAQEAALQNYLEQVGKLLVEEDLRSATLGDNLSTVARAQTLAVLEGLNPNRKRIRTYAVEVSR